MLSLGGALRHGMGAGWDPCMWRRLGWLAGLILLPFVVWLMGSGLVWVAPKSYRSEVLVQVGAAELSGEVARLRSSWVMEEAARLLAGAEQGRDPMSPYLLWTSVSATEWRGPNLIRVEARGSNPEEARRRVQALLEAYRLTLENELGAVGAPNLVYVDPRVSHEPRVDDGVRMALGLGGVALMGLLLAIPLLKQVERWVPLRKDEALVVLSS